MANCPPASFIYERPPFRAAAAARRNQHYRQTWWDGIVAVRRSWAAPGLCSGRFGVAATAIYSRIWKYPINQLEECSRGSVVAHMHRISLGIVGFEQKGGEAVKL
jgi:hypothetical protein